MKSENKMGVLPIPKLILTMSIPPITSMFMQYSYNFVDSAFVAHISENALTAVSLSFPITALMCAFSIGIGVGINVLIARYLGRKEQDNADTVTTLGILIAFICGVILNIGAMFIIKPYFRAFTDNEEIFALCMEYMSVCVFMQVPNMVHIAIQKIIQGTGNMIAPMCFQIAGVLFNLVFDPVLIFGIGIFPKMGIKGAALSTVLGYTLSMILAFYALIGRKQKVRIKIKGFKIQKDMVRDVFVLGFPSFIMNALNSFMVTFANFFLAAYSMTSIAFFGAYYKAQHMIVMTVNGLIQGCLPIMSFSYGAKRFDRLNTTYVYGTVAAGAMMCIGAALLFVFPDEILGLFNASEEMLSLGRKAMKIMALGYAFNGISTMTATYMQAVGKVKISLSINLMRQFTALLPVMFIFSRLWQMDGIWWAFPATETITLIFALFMLKKTYKKAL